MNEARENNIGKDEGSRKKYTPYSLSSFMKFVNNRRGDFKMNGRFLLSYSRDFPPPSSTARPMAKRVNFKPKINISAIPSTASTTATTTHLSNMLKAELRSIVDPVISCVNLVVRLLESRLDGESRRSPNLRPRGVIRAGVTTLGLGEADRSWMPCQPY